MLKPDQGLALKLGVSSDDFQERLQLKKEINKALKEREFPYLSAFEFDQIPNGNSTSNITDPNSSVKLISMM